MVVVRGWKGGASHRKAFSKPISDGSQGHKPQPTLELIKSKKEMNKKNGEGLSRWWWWWGGGSESDSLDKQDGPWSSFRGCGGGRLSGVSFLTPDRDGRRERRWRRSSSGRRRRGQLLT